MCFQLRKSNVPNCVLWKMITTEGLHFCFICLRAVDKMSGFGYSSRLKCFVKNVCNEELCVCFFYLSTSCFDFENAAGWRVLWKMFAKEEFKILFYLCDIDDIFLINSISRGWLCHVRVINGFENLIVFDFEQQCEFWKGFIKLFEWMILLCYLFDNCFWARHFLFSIFDFLHHWLPSTEFTPCFYVWFFMFDF